MSALNAEAVAAQVVMAARRTDETTRGIGLQPALILSSVPDAILGSEHPASPFAVEHREVADGKPESSSLQSA